jgi:hypothetical protein
MLTRNDMRDISRWTGVARCAPAPIPRSRVDQATERPPSDTMSLADAAQGQAEHRLGSKR